jgi:hypothetical protein
MPFPARNPPATCGIQGPIGRNAPGRRFRGQSRVAGTVPSILNDFVHPYYMHQRAFITWISGALIKSEIASLARRWEAMPLCCSE